MSDELEKTRVMPAIDVAVTEVAPPAPVRPSWRRPWVLGTVAVLFAVGAANGGASGTEEVADREPAPFSLPAPATSSSAVPPAPAPAGVAYENCDDVRSHGAAPIRAGDPGWQPEFDGNGDDGIGCE